MTQAARLARAQRNRFVEYNEHQDWQLFASNHDEPFSSRVDANVAIDQEYAAELAYQDWGSCRDVEVVEAEESRSAQISQDYFIAQ